MEELQKLYDYYIECRKKYKRNQRLRHLALYTFYTSIYLYILLHFGCDKDFIDNFIDIIYIIIASAIMGGFTFAFNISVISPILEHNKTENEHLEHLENSLRQGLKAYNKSKDSQNNKE